MRVPPREFIVGANESIKLKDCGSVRLEFNEQITFITKSGAEYDVARKDWGFYATPSVNGRLKNHGFKTALVRNNKGQIYVMIVESAQIKKFELYCQTEEQQVLEWLDERSVREFS